MNSSIKIIMTLMCFFSLLSCGKKVFISEENLAAIDIYNIGDELVFQNVATKAMDTSTIVKKEVYHANYDWFRHDGYQPHIARVLYKNKRLRYEEGTLISAEKRKPDDKDGFGVSYLNTTFFFYDLDKTDLDFYNVEDHDLKVLHTVTMKSTSKVFNEVYILSNKKHSRHKPEDDVNPQRLYWDRKYGIIKYVTYNGEVWERVNW